MQNHMNKLSGAAILSVLACSTLAWLLLGIPSSGINDADVYLVYARNFLEGHGFVYNVGGEQLEGFPSLLWMLICSFVYIFSRAVEVPLLLLNLLFGIITVYICLKRCNQKTAFLVLLCSAPAWFAWCQIALVESGLWCLLLTATILAVSERNTSKVAWLLPLLVVTRPEAMLWGCWLLLVLFLGFGMDRGWRIGLRKIFLPVFTFGTTWAVLALFRGLYFGNVLPSSSSSTPVHGLQVDLGAGVAYLLGYLFSNPAVLLAVLVFGWVCVREISRKRGLSRVLVVCLCLLPGLAIPLMAGDESFRAFRFYQPVWPLLCLVAAWAMPLLYERQGRLIRRMAPVLLMLAGWMIFAMSVNLKHEFTMARKSREQGSVLARMFEGHTSLPSVGTMSAGGCKYAYPGKVYDLKGLAAAKTDPIPRAKQGAESRPPFDREVFHEWYPDILIRSASDAFNRRVFTKLQSERWFQKRYLKGELWYNDEILFGYFSKRLLNGLEEGHYAFSQDLQYTLSMEAPLDLSVDLPDEALKFGFAAQDKDGLAAEFLPLWSPPQKF
ncbi:MAG: hypothetical protein DRP64_03645 [Verrucomicrobia bacterium]|nr:MAG: hypothetical protein DRP64_03645 [Verrucomicrobiota bacterium]